MRRWIFRTLVLTLTVACVLGAIVVVGQWSLERIRGRERYLLPLHDIDCLTPPGVSHNEFLDEVQYHGRLPDHVNLLDADLGDRLAKAFAQHPWVAKVDEIRIDPPRVLKVQLHFRRPVLAVRTGDVVRVVDADGILLPRKAPTDFLPLYDAPAGSPQGPEGTRWGDPAVEARARSLKR